MSIFSKIHRSIRVNRQLDNILDNICDVCNEKQLCINGSKDISVTDIILYFYEKKLIVKTKEEKIINLADILVNVLELKTTEGTKIDKHTAIQTASEVFNHGIR